MSSQLGRRFVRHSFGGGGSGGEGGLAAPSCRAIASAEAEALAKAGGATLPKSLISMLISDNFR